MDGPKAVSAFESATHSIAVVRTPGRHSHFVPKPAVSNRSNAAPHSITLSARSMIEAVTTRPSDFAVCTLIISSNRTGRMVSR
jgi:hypothetical protein